MVARLWLAGAFFSFGLPAGVAKRAFQLEYPESYRGSRAKPTICCG